MLESENPTAHRTIHGSSAAVTFPAIAIAARIDSQFRSA
jgi:hypothetical protein